MIIPIATTKEVSVSWLLTLDEAEHEKDAADSSEGHCPLSELLLLLRINLRKKG